MFDIPGTKFSLISDPNPSVCSLSWCFALHHATLQGKDTTLPECLMCRGWDGKNVSDLLDWIQLLKDVATLGLVN